MCKKFICFVSFVLILGLASSASASLAAWWEFEDNLNDSYSSRNLTIAGGTPTYVAGRMGSKAILFDGDDDYVSLPTAGKMWSHFSDEITVALWVYGDDSAPVDAEVWQGMKEGNRVLYTKIPYTNESVYWDAPWPDRLTAAVTSNMYKGAWNHYVFTKNNNTGDQKMYHNGELLAGNTDADITLDMDGFWLGKGRSANWIGAVDDMAIWNNELDAQHILYISKYGVPEPATIALLGLGGLLLIRRKRR